MSNNSPQLVTSNGEISNFRLCEFANEEGTAMVHLPTLDALQEIRNHLNIALGGEVRIIITNATRTKGDNNRLGRLYGWAPSGKVSRDSQHLVRNGCTAVDFIAINSMGEPLPRSIVANAAEKYFKFVKSYSDGHIHADMRGT